MTDDSVFIGVVPFIGSTIEYNKVESNTKLRLPWREKLYDEYYTKRIEALQSH